MLPYALHWFRRDLRIAGNPALQNVWKEYQGRVLGFFCFDPAFLSRPDFSANRFAFFLETLSCLRQELQQAGGDLLVLDQGPKEAFKKLFEILKSHQIPFPRAIAFNRDYEPFALKRDEMMMRFFEKEHGVRVHTERDHLLVEPWEILKDEGKKSFYRVYSPFAKKWLEKLQSPEIQSRIYSQKKALQSLIERSGKQALKNFHLTWKELFRRTCPFEDQLENYKKTNRPQITVPLPPAGALAAINYLKEFKEKLQSYDKNRDYPALPGTSRLSIYLKNGSITISQVIAYLELEQLKDRSGEGALKYLKELIWREFYYSILYHFPRVEKESFLEKFKNVEWENREDYFEAWKEGRTGYPIVDAGMRELKQTGWMHNRARMIVASFLTKDLLIDWKWGEQYFMTQLLDGDLAANNGGWQWAASTGCDPQPYFRIFNPILQSQKFDPQGEYIRTYIPELAHLNHREIHEPWRSPRATVYPPPIVEHSHQREIALKLYLEAR